MIVKRIYEAEKPEDHSCQWFNCDFAVEMYDKGKGFNELLMYKDHKLIGTVDYDPKNKNGFTLYFLEEGKTVDTRHWNLK